MGSSEKSHVRFTTDSSLKSEAYLLEVTPQQILVKASDTKGFFLRIADDPFTAATCYRRQSTGKVP